MRLTQLFPLLTIVLAAGCSTRSPEAAPGDETAISDGEAAAPVTESPGPNGRTAELQGVWRRVSYPHGTLEFRGAEVKDNVGEGLPETPEFEAFRTADACPYGTPGDRAFAYPAFVVRDGGRNCFSYDITGDTLRVDHAAGGGGIVYAREE